MADFDLFVIGAGSGGVRAARVSAAYGARVGIAEEHKVGGTCVIRGCVPKKLLVYGAHFAEDLDDAAMFGWDVPTKRFDWQVLRDNVLAEVSRLEGAYTDTLTNHDVTIFHERAELTGPNSLRLASGKEVTADKILIATGNRPTRELGTTHVIPGGDLCITSDEAFHLDKLPGRILIAGGGYIALEFAHIFHGLGVEVSLIYRGEKVLRGFDDDIRDSLQDSMQKRGLHVALGCEFTKIERRGDCLHAETSKGDVIETDEIMLAIGRAPNTEMLHVEKAGVELGRRGEVKVDRFSRTNAEHIYAIGDVTDRVQLTPVAIHEAMCFAKTAFEGKPTAPDHENIATAVFTTPEIGVVGMSEMKALGLGHAIDVYKSTFTPLRHTLTGSKEKMMMKLIIDQKTDKMLGCHIFGYAAAEIIQVVGVALKMGATKADFDATIALHPSAAEELVTMRAKSYSKAP